MSFHLPTGLADGRLKIRVDPEQHPSNEEDQSKFERSSPSDIRQILIIITPTLDFDRCSSADTYCEVSSRISRGSPGARHSRF